MADDLYMRIAKITGVDRKTVKTVLLAVEYANAERLVAEREARILAWDRANPEGGTPMFASVAHQQAIVELKLEKLIPPDYEERN